MKKAVKVSSLLCPTLCDPMDCSLPVSSVRGVLQTRILEWVAIPFSRVLSDPGIESRSTALQTDSLASESPGKPIRHHACCLLSHFSRV